MALSNYIFGQDYLVKPDGTKLDGKIISMHKNTVKLKNEGGEVQDFKIVQLSTIHIADQNFKMKGVHLTNTNYEKNEEGIFIQMLDNPISNSKPTKKLPSTSKTTNINIKSEKSSSLSITSEDDRPKAKVILECDDCATSGNLEMISEDKETLVSWTFDTKGDNVFPMEMEVDCCKRYHFRFKDKNGRSIDKKVKVDIGVNAIKIWQ